MFKTLKTKTFDILVKNHAAAILKEDFPTEVAELEKVLSGFSISADELISSGGGEAKSTQRMRHDLASFGWKKHNFNFTSQVDGIQLASISHEIDHVKRTQNGTIALEIEWNNKDPFFDRDLENFQRLHAQSVISLGIIITRGETLQRDLVSIIQNCLKAHNVNSEADLSVFDMKDRTKRQSEMVAKAMATQKISFSEAFAKPFVSDKFGQATTHWRKLEDRVLRGVGNPCPLLLIGIPSDIVK